ncbi:zinc ABC transporter substrate-binding protein [Pseudooceanicola aestuarii]|uniref:zinc ABC transporter substrate-binding protein n=1 Tax=Pseudooceanicola aestuarii TaxID=2697319 RepID=UPI0013D2840C|nr:zinc ABC transporter substrate-binding protein [Pseudooceanicola aestuarii]
MPMVVGLQTMRSTRAIAALAAAPVRADVPAIVTDIPPIHALTSAVMGDLGQPSLLIDSATSPHAVNLRPSQARALAGAGLVIRVGPEQTPWLAEALENLGGGVSLPLLEVPGTQTLEVRKGILFAPAKDEDDHGDHDAHGHDDHGHDDHEGHADHSDHDDHDGHDHSDHEDDHGDHGHDDHGHDDHGDHRHDDHGHGDHAHAHDGTDPHAWLNPDNAVTWTRAIAEALAQADPENAETYRVNAEGYVDTLSRLAAELAPLLTDLPGGYVTLHDAYQYLETRYDLPAEGSLSHADGTEAGPARIAALRDAIANHGVTCLFTEPQLSRRQADRLAHDLKLETGVLDPLGQGLTTGADLYPELMRNMAQALNDCLAG